MIFWAQRTDKQLVLTVSVAVKSVRNPVILQSSYVTDSDWYQVWFPIKPLETRPSSQVLITMIE
jgi:hypothetical protein